MGLVLPVHALHGRRAIDAEEHGHAVPVGEGLVGPEAIAESQPPLTERGGTGLSKGRVPPAMSGADNGTRPTCYVRADDDALGLDLGHKGAQREDLG